MQERRDYGFGTVGIRTGRIWDWRDSKLEGYRKLGFRTGGMLDRSDTGQVVLRTGEMQDR